MLIPAFSESRRMRLAVGALLYLAQGFPQAAVFYTVVTWLAVQGRSSAEIASVASAATLAWSLKAFASPLVDRYTFAPMGRRRPWLIGSQALILAALLVFGLLRPSADQISLITGLVVVIAISAAVQDIALDALVIDLTPDDEKGQLNGFMMTGKLLGMAGGMAVGGLLIERSGIGEAMLAMCGLFAIPAAVAVLVRERPGEKMLPWSPGSVSSATKPVALVGWRKFTRPLRASMMRRDTLLIVAVIGISGIAAGIYQQGMVLFGVRQLGWGEARMGTLGAVSYVALAVPALLLGGIIDRVSPQRAGPIAGLAAFLAFGALTPLSSIWPGEALFVLWVLVSGLAAMFLSLVGLVLAMRISLPTVAATSFAVLMVADPIGGAAGTALVPALEALGGYYAIFWTAASLGLAAGLITFFTIAPCSAMQAPRKHNIDATPSQGASADVSSAVTAALKG